MQYVGQSLRDIVGEGGVAFRFGGEEFTVLLPGRGGEDGAALAETIRTTMSSCALSYAGKLLDTVTVSIGVGSSPEEGSIETLLSRADAALLQAKAEGRNKVVFRRSKSLGDKR
jgi:diguanylate cyclase (GGDEF)-like protein